ncbi:MAG: SulP family inorganic anion transporter [Dehalococcoidia bacterium]|nr:SulP family inorganic anion transporter [Dehalococcoidia bacterium]MCB9484685.1 SulP family inorganic anion transporter [Thermoflexaceae bacterium]
MSASPARIVMPAPAMLRTNVLSGLVVGVIAIPLSIALAVAVGVPPVAGLYTAVFAGATASVFGGSRFNITGPTAALVPILASAVLTYGPGALPMLGIMAGIILLGMSFFRLGRLIRYMPGLVVVGFTAGIALSIAFGQLNSLLAVTGTDPSLEHFHEKLWDTISHLGSVRLAAPLLGVGSIPLLFAWPRIPWLGRVPGPLVVVLLATAISWGFGLDVPTIGSRYGDLPSGFPRPSARFFDVGLVFDLIPLAAAVAVLGGVESLLSAMVADGMVPGSTRFDADRELRGQGLANLVSPFMGGIPATAAIARTAAGIRNGATSRISGVVHALTVLAATVALGGLAAHIPLAALAAILLVVAWNIAEVPELARLLRRAPREDLVVLVATASITLFFDLTYAIGAGILASMFILLRNFMRMPAAAELIPGSEERFRDISPGLHGLVRSRPDIAVFTAQGVLSFHSAAAFEFEISSVDSRPLIIRMKNVQHVDSTGLLTLEAIIHHRRRHGGRIQLSAVQPSVYAALDRFGILDLVGHENVFASTAEAIASCPLPPSGHSGPRSVASAVGQ